MAEQAVMYFDIALTTNHYIRMFCALIGKEVQCENYRSVGRVFERDNTEVGLSRLYLAKDIFNCRLWRKGMAV
jgi:hypothetical protein